MREDGIRKVTGSANPLQKASKIKLVVFLVVVLCFAYGLGTKAAQRATELSQKTIRNIYIQLRRRLLKDRFARWHRANTRLIKIASRIQEENLRDAFFSALAHCHFNENCFRNFAGKKRKSRTCRKCPLKDTLTTQGADEAIMFSDSVRTFYRRLNISAEARGDRQEVFKERAIHTATIIEAANATKKRTDGSFDYTDMEPLAFRTLLEILIVDLAENPIEGDH